MVLLRVHLVLDLDFALALDPVLHFFFVPVLLALADPCAVFGFAQAAGAATRSSTASPPPPATRSRARVATTRATTTDPTTGNSPHTIHKHFNCRIEHDGENERLSVDDEPT